MREIKFRYRFKNRKTGEEFTTVLTIFDIEIRGFTPRVFEGFDWEVLSRDQYTGLKDKNGKEAYHKDRVSALGYSNWIIEWYRNGWKLFQEGSVCNYLDIPDDFVITGNIYEN